MKLSKRLRELPGLIALPFVFIALLATGLVLGILEKIQSIWTGEPTSDRRAVDDAITHQYQHRYGDKEED